MFTGLLGRLKQKSSAIGMDLLKEGWEEQGRRAWVVSSLSLFFVKGSMTRSEVSLDRAPAAD